MQQLPLGSDRDEGAANGPFDRPARSASSDTTAAASIPIHEWAALALPGATPLQGEPSRCFARWRKTWPHEGRRKHQSDAGHGVSACHLSLVNGDRYSIPGDRVLSLVGI